MSLHVQLSNFSGGEWSPQLVARNDLQKYSTAVQDMTNMRPLPWGGATFRAGTLYVAQAKYSDRVCRVIPFNYSATVAYAIEMGDLYMRFYRVVGPPSTPAFWISSNAYAIDAYVKWKGLVYRCILAVASTVAPVYNNSPDSDSSHWVLQSSYQLAQVQTSTDAAEFWINVRSYSVGQYVQRDGIVYVCISTVTATVPPAYNLDPSIDPTHWTPQTTYELTTPFTAGEVFDVQFKEINDVMYLVHPNHPPQKLTRTSAVTFTIADVAWKYPAFLDENLDQTIKLTLGAITGSTTLTASSAIFSSSHIGSYWEIKHLSQLPPLQQDISGASATSASIEVVGDYTFTTSQNWWGTINIERSTDGGTTWRIARSFISKSNHNVEVSGNEAAPTAGQPRTLLRIAFISAGDPYATPPWSSGAPTSYVYASCQIEVSNAYIAGLAKVTGYVSSTVLNVTMVSKAASTAATEFWSEGAWSAYRGYPRTVGLFEQRALYAGTSYKPNTVWGSVSADFENFLYGDLDDSAIAYQPATCQQNFIQWLEALERMFLGTEGEELGMTSGNDNEAMTPSNVTIRGQSGNGSLNIQPLVVGKALLFVERQGRRIRELMEGNPYLEKGGPAPIDLTLLAEHITDGGVLQLAFGKQPDQQVFAALGSGLLAMMTYNKEQNINAWTKYQTRGRFESVCVINGTPADVAVLVTTRALPTGDRKYIEVFTAESTDKTEGIMGMDCATILTQAPSSTVNVGSFLEGMRVAVVADGQVIGDAFTGVGALTVTGGAITLPEGYQATRVRVGLPYFGALQPMPIDQNLSDGTSYGRKRRINELVIRFKDSLGGVYGNANRNAYDLDQYGDEILFRSADDAMDASPPLFTGDKVLPWAAGAGLSNEVKISQLQPFPMTVLGLFARVDYFGQ